jgi:hypothetical protein
MCVILTRSWRENVCEISIQYIDKKKEIIIIIEQKVKGEKDRKPCVHVYDDNIGILIVLVSVMMSGMLFQVQHRIAIVVMSIEIILF